MWKSFFPGVPSCIEEENPRNNVVGLLCTCRRFLKQFCSCWIEAGAYKKLCDASKNLDKIGSLVQRCEDKTS